MTKNYFKRPWHNDRPKRLSKKKTVSLMLTTLEGIGNLLYAAKLEGDHQIWQAINDLCTDVKKWGRR